MHRPTSASAPAAPVPVVRVKRVRDPWCCPACHADSRRAAVPSAPVPCSHARGQRADIRGLSDIVMIRSFARTLGAHPQTDQVLVQAQSGQAHAPWYVFVVPHSTAAPLTD